MQQRVSEIWLQTCSSTNDEAIRLARSGVIAGSFVISDLQTAGRGRRGRTWSSPMGGLYMSVITRPVLPVGEQYRVALAAGVAVVETLMSYGVKPQLKWPNDVVIDGKKLAGILTEVTPGAVVVGVGVNMSVHDPIQELPAGSIELDKFVSKAPDRAHLARYLALSINSWARRCYSSDFLDVVRLWRTYMERRTVVTVDVAGLLFDSTQHDLHDDGSLVVKSVHDDSYQTISCGDVQIVAEQPQTT
jgi:BirA family transcriptional regulator, biotin operon repressor / biotin---[acetyl-CoA-carboxylase] ligase